MPLHTDNWRLITELLDLSRNIDRPCRLGYASSIHQVDDAMPKVLHPHITSDPAICGGSPRIDGTRITVRTVVMYVLHHGMSPEELLVSYPHLNLASIYDALSYYYDNREDIDREIAENDALDPANHPFR